MARKGEENLIPTNQRSKEEVREIGRKGGVASGKARRRKRDLKKSVDLLLAKDIPKNQQKMLKILEGLGIDEEDMTFNMAVAASMMMKAVGGNVRAAEFLANVAGQYAAHDLDKQKFNHQKKIDKQKMENFDTTLADPSELIEVLKRDD